MPLIDFSNVRPHGGSKNSGFEELCAQLAYLEFADRPDWRFTRKGGSADGGVECYWQLPDGTEYCWQVKYVDDLDKALNQVDTSVKQAIAKHPKMVKYFVCLSIDFADSRKNNDVTQKVKWDQHLTKWQEQAKAAEMDVEFIPWGQFELSLQLSKDDPEYLGRRLYWFDEKLLNDEWLQGSLASVLAEAGPRYTPELHIELPSIYSKLIAVAQDNEFFKSLTDLENHFAECARRCSLEKSTAEAHPSVEAKISEILEKTKTLKQKFFAFRFPKSIPENLIQDIVSSAEAIINLVDIASKEMWDLQQERQARLREEGKDVEYYRDPLYSAEHYLRRFRASLCDLNEYLEAENEGGLWASRFLILTGAAGIGKTHALYDFAEHRLAKGFPTIMLLGQNFSSLSDPWIQILERLGLNKLSRDEFLGALDAAADSRGVQGLIIIDAINEGQGGSIWPKRLAGFANELRRFKNLSLIVSVRDTYYHLNVPDNIENIGAKIVDHPGFTGVEYQATLKFFEHYQIKLPSTPLLNPEFSNPLFLKLFCEGLHSEGITEIPKGGTSLNFVFDLFIKAKYKKMARDYGYDPRENILPSIVAKLAEEMAMQSQRWIPRARAKAIITEAVPNKANEFKDGLFFHLVTENILIESINYDLDHNEVASVGFSYERFSDYLVVDQILSEVLIPDIKSTELRRRFLKHPVLQKLFNTDYFPNGWLESLCLQIPEKTGHEIFAVLGNISLKDNKLLDFVTENTDKALNFISSKTHRTPVGQTVRNVIYKRNEFTRLAHREFVESLIWRSSSSITETTVSYLSRTRHTRGKILEILYSLATVEDNLLNANRLHKIFARQPMPERDAIWATQMAFCYSDAHPIQRLVDWAWQENHAHISNASIRLAAIATIWLFICSNRTLRDIATKALANLFQGRLEVVPECIALFSKIDDPYIKERLYAAVYGALLILQEDAPLELLRNIASEVYKAEFSNGTPTISISVRDYARLIINVAETRGIEDFIANEDRINPPYQSQWPLEIPTKEELETYFKDDDDKKPRRGLFSIRFSVINGGDFEKYQIQHYNHWYDLELSEPSPPPNVEKLASKMGELSEHKHEIVQNCFVELAEIIRVGRTLDSCYYDVRSGRFTSWKLMRFVINDAELPRTEDNLTDALSAELEAVNNRIIQVEDRLQSELETNEFPDLLSLIRNALDKPEDCGKVTLFTTDKMANWICKRIFELGWTEERFGDFDEARNSDRHEQIKIERIGKKYAWIALDEVGAILCDHLKFCREKYEGFKDLPYRGLWDISARDIDPSVLVKPREDLSYKTSPVCWWQPQSIDFFPVSVAEQAAWISTSIDIPEILQFLLPADPNGVRWALLEGYYSWYEQKLRDDEGHELPYRNIFLKFDTFLVKKAEFEALKEKVESTSRSYDWLPYDNFKLNQTFLGELPDFGPANDYVEDNDVVTIKNTSVNLIHTSAEYSYMSDYDASYPRESVYIPSKFLIKNLNLRRRGGGFNHFQNDLLATICPQYDEFGPDALLCNIEIFQEFLSQKDLILCWGVSGQKMLLNAHREDVPALRDISGFYYLTDAGNVAGTINSFVRGEGDADADD